jgi:hypothetical protein
VWKHYKGNMEDAIRAADKEECPEAESFSGSAAVQAHIASLAPAKDDDVICECWKCDKDMTSKDVEDIPPEEFHEDFPECEDCREAVEWADE